MLTNDKLKNLIIRKSRADGELISGLVSVVIIIITTLLMINLMMDVYGRTQIDQVARRYIMILETSDWSRDAGYNGGLATQCRDDLMQIPLVYRAVNGRDGATATSFVNDPNWWKVVYTPNSAVYGARITLTINVPVTNTSWILRRNNGSLVNGAYGIINRSRVIRCVVTKQSTVKY